MKIKDMPPNEWALKFLYLWDLKRGQKEIVFAVLHCHLIINYFIDEFINKMNPNLGNMSKIRIGFEEKLKLIKPTNKDSLLPKIIKGIKQLNTIRNKMAHELVYDLQESGVSEMAAALDIVPEHNYKKEDPLKVINSFGPFVVGVLDAEVSKPKLLAKALRLHKPKKSKS